MIERIEAIARDIPDAVGTVGLIENRPNSRNVIPGEVFFTVDFRHPDDKVLDFMEAKLRAALAEILPPLQLTYRESRIWASPPVHFSPELIDCVGSRWKPRVFPHATSSRAPDTTPSISPASRRRP